MSDGRAAPSPRCAHCHDRVGIYEPLVHQSPSGGSIRTSLTARPEVARFGRIFHASCWALREHIDRLRRV